MLKPRHVFLAQVEHVLPRAPRGDWLRLFADEDERAELRGYIGNYCLLPKQVNEDLGNDQWARKRNAYRSIDKCFRGAMDVAGHERWIPEAIRKRTHDIGAYLDDLLELGTAPITSYSRFNMGHDFDLDDEIPF